MKRSVLLVAFGGSESIQFERPPGYARSERRDGLRLLQVGVLRCDYISLEAK